MPKVTVLMSVYNREHFVREAIDSILAQTLHDFEFIIINDGSTDKTREIILSYKDPRIQLVDNSENLGIPKSLNKGLNLAQGEFVARFDSDDISEPQRLARQVAFLDANPKTVLVGSWYEEIDEQGNILQRCTLPCDCTQIRWGLLFYTPFLNSSAMFRRTVVLQGVGFYNQDFIYAQDHELWARIASLFPIANLSEYLVKYRVHPSSITLFHETRQYDLLFQSCKNYMSILFSHNEFEPLIEKSVFTIVQSLLNYYPEPDWRKIEIEKMQKAIEVILKLNQYFCDRYAINNIEIKKHQSTLIVELAIKLIAMDVKPESINQVNKIVKELVMQSYLLDPFIVLNKRFQITLGRLVIGHLWLTVFKNIRYHQKRSKA